MGSGTTRKPNDSVIINRPKPKKDFGTGGGGGSDGGEHQDMNNVCPPTFRTKLNTSKPLPEGSLLHIQEDNIIHSGQKVGLLTKAQSATITRCSTDGFRYSGKVVIERGMQHGVFTRT